jgi:signal transduction histidine kinase/DNA-binding response OmpR family regulator
VNATVDPHAIFSGESEMARRMRALDWSKTALGPVANWPTSLKTTVGVLLGNRFPMCLFWGAELTNINNDAYRPILGEKHPASLGASGREIWKEIWHILGPQAEGVLGGGPATWNEHLLLPMNRRGYVEETYFTFSYSPVPADDGRVGGVLVTCQETTDQVQDARQLRMLQELSAHAMQERSAEEACQAAMQVLSSHATDLPFAMAYLLDEHGTRATLAGTAGLSDEQARDAATKTALEAGAHSWPFLRVLCTGADEVTDLDAHLCPLPACAAGAVRSAMVLPLARPGHERPWGFLVAGVNPWRALDERYRRLFRLTADRIASAIANAQAYAEERRRAEALSEIDRAKTAFFSNVSHEFRTPLSLMLGPLEDALSGSRGGLEGEDLRAVHRNSLRLLKLVNTLLDFSRIEAGRAQASYAPSDLASLTRDFASAFRSAIERGGLRFEVECEALSEPVYVDRDMWEKLCANLLSNAFKYTFDGTIAVRLRARRGRVELTVTDTGVGIAEHELPRVFERFHRIEGARARTHEGSGIGLALVHEIVRLHGGTASVASRVGQGTTFTVEVPLGCAHLPPERVGAPPPPASTALGTQPFVQEALRWLPDPPASTAPPLALVPASPATAARVLVADDNADMREYLTRLLSPHWIVRAVADGAQAQALVREFQPELVVSDVMMPNLDGFGLLAALRADPATARVPVIMLSARAGEESRIEGLEAGADDYLVKPFSARELVARVATHIQLARARAESERERERLHHFLMGAPFAIVWLDGPEHRVVLSNPQHRALVGGRDLTGMSLVEGLPELAGREAMDVLSRVYRTGESFTHEEHLIPLERDGRLEDRWFNLVYRPVRNAAGEVEGILGCGVEVTLHVRARRELERARELAESAARAKDEFLAMLGHELRNPLVPILTALQLLQLRERGGRELNVIARQVQHLMRLVDDLLDVSRITRGKLELRKQPIELANAVLKGLEIASPLLERRRQRVRLDVPPDGLVVDADPDRLAQVVSNLLTNAAKYSEPDTQVEVEARRAGSSVELRVRDQGIGIAPEMLGRVFDTFVQQPQALDRSKGGLGLGLSIVRSLVGLHGGTVRAHSDGLGCGSEFVVTLPPSSHAQPSEPDTPAQPAAAEPAGAAKGVRRILVVDDNADAAVALAELLAELGHEVRVAHDGLEALALARAFRPDVCLLDIGLPVMDGYELAQRLRSQAELPEGVRMVAITGYGRDADRRRSKEAGFDAHLVKPVAFNALTCVIAS